MTTQILETFGATSAKRLVMEFDTYDAFAQSLGYAYTVLKAQFLQVDTDYPRVRGFYYRKRAIVCNSTERFQAMKKIATYAIQCRFKGKPTFTVGNFTIESTNSFYGDLALASAQLAKREPCYVVNCHPLPICG